MTHVLLTEFYLPNLHKFEYLETGADDFNDSSVIREHLMSLKLYNFNFSDSMTGAWWYCVVAVPVCVSRSSATRFFFLKEALHSGLGHQINL